MTHSTQVYLLAQCEAGVPSDQAWLGAAGLEQLAKLRFPKRRADWRLGRWTACLALRASPFASASALVWVEPAASGAPEAVVDGVRGRCAISLSHSGGHAVCAVAAPFVELGCDIERIEPRAAGFAEDFFTSCERDMLERAPDVALATTIIWSAKESALKALQQGLRLDTRSVAVELPAAPAGTGWQPLAVSYRSGARLFHGWWHRFGHFVVTVVGSPRPRLPAWLDSERGR